MEMRGRGALASVSIVLAACAAPSSPPRARSVPPSAPPTATSLTVPVVAAPPLASPEDAGVPGESHAVAPPSPNERTILLIGDSHAMGPFGHRLARLLAGSAKRVVSEAACGATTETFVKVPKVHCGYQVAEWMRDGTLNVFVSTNGPAKTHTLDTMLATYQPSVVVVALGTNYPRAPVGESADALMKQLCHDGSCPRVFWIGPPSFGGEASGYISGAIKKSVERWNGATFIDSTSFNARHPLALRTPHFSDTVAREWAQYAFDPIARALGDR